MKHHNDVSLILEGTYPYVRGGVSSWVHQLIQGMPDYQFYLVFIGGSRDAFGDAHYQLPENVAGIETHYIMETDRSIKVKGRIVPQDIVGQWYGVLSHFFEFKGPLSTESFDFLMDHVEKNEGFTRRDFLHSQQSWDVLIQLYEIYANNQSFIDYFWTFRNIFNPIFKLVEIVRGLPRTRLVHSISTGYAGFLGSLIKHHQQVPYLISEHGIYTKERKIDLSQAEWIKERHNALDNSMHRSNEQTRQMWISFFEQLGRTSYAFSNRITALYEGNRRRQILDGAPEEKTRVIVNGIKMARFNEAYEKRPEKPPKIAALVGRVVPIKDIKTFIRAIAICTSDDPEVVGWIVGPTEEDKEYFHECEMLVQSLNLQESVKFLGMQNVAEIFSQVGVCILSSISEAQPLVLLEAMASGVPCIATNVGSSAEIINGMTEEDKKLGSCGWVTNIASPDKIADAITTCFDPQTPWHKIGDNGRERVKLLYREEMMFERFHDCYEELLSWPV